MNITIFLVACVILLCVFVEKFSDRIGIPALIFFMFIGMLFGSDGILKIPFDDFKLAENICSIALIFIMFYGGFNTKWKAARSVAGKSVLLSTVGVVATACITMLLCKVFLQISWAESLLIGAVLSSTDAASVFAILRKNKLNLKDGTASILEVESGSNDPVSYMLTIVAVSVVNTGGFGNVFGMIALQLILGVAIGLILAKITLHFLVNTKLVSEGLETIYMIAAVMICYAVTAYFGGNAYLSVYLFGIYIGNQNVKKKGEIIPFFDGVTSLAQILIFFLIGLLTFPHQMPQIIPTALAITAFLTLIARPVTVFLLLKPFKCSWNQCLLIAWAGLRGASSSVFAIMAVAAGVSMKQELFHIVFMVSLFSVAIQGTFLPNIAKKLDMVDARSDVRKTFNDYQEEVAFQLMKMHIPEEHNWANRMIKDVNMPSGSLALMIKRGKESIITKGNTLILPGDDIILSVTPYNPGDSEKLQERIIEKEDSWCNKTIGELKLSKNKLIAMVIRNNQPIIPDGKTKILENDVVVFISVKGA